MMIYRAGVISALARAGADKDIMMSQGRWSSEAYLAYIKLGRAQRLSTQKKVAETICSLAHSNFGQGILVA